MKIESIKSIGSTYYGTKSNHSFNKNLSFQGYVNGSFYKDEIITLAKKYQNSSNWKSELRQGKQSVADAIKTWHHDVTWGSTNDETEETMSRVCLGVFTFGIAEALMDLGYGISAAVNNKKIENIINEVAKCIDDLNKSK